jgi:hypothetical protein
VEGGGWRVEGGGRRVEGGGWRVEGGGWRGHEGSIRGGKGRESKCREGKEEEVHGSDPSFKRGLSIFYRRERSTWPPSI